MSDGGGIDTRISCTRGIRALLFWKYNTDNILGREGLSWSTRLLILPITWSAVIKANTYCQPKVSESVKKEVEWHQLQLMPALPPLYTNPCNLFMPLDLLHFLLLSPCCPHSLQDFHSSFLPSLLSCLWLPAPAWPGRAGQGPRAAPTPGTSGMLPRWLWKLHSVIVFMARVG